MDEIRIVIVDDHPLFRQGVIDAVSLEDDILIIGQAEEGFKAYAIIKEIRPDIVILDINLPGVNGLVLTKKISSKNWPTRVILITAYDDEDQVIHAMRYGAWAYQSKDIKPEELVEIIRWVAAGYYVVDGKRLKKGELDLWLEKRVEEIAHINGNPGDSLRPLSKREMEVLSYLTQGMSNKEIATLLSISHQTVKNHVTSILRKLGVGDRTQAVVYALRRGWFHLHDSTL